MRNTDNYIEFVGYVKDAARALDWAHWHGLNLECDAIGTADEDSARVIMDRLVDIMADLEKFAATL